MATAPNTNHLSAQTSPYLLQHANNPVNWYPWGDEAFALAAAQNKPIFLSIGYSTCHWCHVMAHESFEDKDVAALLNKNFISIKVDREERPDIDAVYMAVSQALTGSGGWPLTIFMAPDKQAFFAGTYFPKHTSRGRIGLIELLKAVALQWKQDQKQLLTSAGEITAALQGLQQGPRPDNLALNKETIRKALHLLAEAFDPVYGGFGKAPKFPTPHYLLFLLHASSQGLHPKALAMAEKTLTAMYQGGLFDHVGFGFSRYATDEKWLAPHFEKMLYDNALLVLVCCDAYQITKKDLYRYIAQKTLLYIQREMTDPQGGFYSAQDADSQGEEGKYYTWHYNEILELLGAEAGKAFAQRYQVTPGGNFEGKNILNLIDQGEAFIPDEQTAHQLNTLYQARLERYPLHKDDKILLSWNAMMIAAFARAARVFNEKSYLLAAQKAFAFISEQMTRDKGRLYVSFRDQKALGTGLLDDYAYLAFACLELYSATFNPQYLTRCKSLLAILQEDFADNTGAYYLSSRQTGDLLYRPKEFYDGALPSANSILTYVFTQMAKLTGDPVFQTKADGLLHNYSPLFADYPLGYTFALKALLLNLFPSKELVALIPDKEIPALGDALDSHYLPQLSTLVKSPGTQRQIDALAPYTKAYPPPQKEPVFYLCQNFICQAPVNTTNALLEELGLTPNT